MTADFSKWMAATTADFESWVTGAANVSVGLHPTVIVETGDADGAEWTWHTPDGTVCALVWANSHTLATFSLSLHVTTPGGQSHCVTGDVGPLWSHVGTRESARAAAHAWISDNARELS